MINVICPICGHSESKESTRGLPFTACSGPVVESALALRVALTLQTASFAARARLWCSAGCCPIELSSDKSGRKNGIRSLQRSERSCNFELIGKSCFFRPFTSFSRSPVSHPTCEVPFPPRRSGEYRKGITAPARCILYQGVRGSVWDPEPSRERVGDWGSCAGVERFYVPREGKSHRRAARGQSTTG